MARSRTRPDPAPGSAQRQGFEVDRRPRRPGAPSATPARARRIDDRQEAVLERVAAEDVRERGGDDRADAEVAQRPGARARATTRSRSCGRRPAPARRVACGWLSAKSGLGRPAASSASRRRAPRRIRRAGRRQESRRNDLVGVDVVRRQHDRARADDADRLQFSCGHGSAQQLARIGDAPGHRGRGGGRGRGQQRARALRPAGPRSCDCWC